MNGIAQPAEWHDIPRMNGIENPVCKLILSPCKMYYTTPFAAWQEVFSSQPVLC